MSLELVLFGELVGICEKHPLAKKSLLAFNKDQKLSTLKVTVARNQPTI